MKYSIGNEVPGEDRAVLRTVDEERLMQTFLKLSRGRGRLTQSLSVSCYCSANGVGRVEAAIENEASAMISPITSFKAQTGQTQQWF